MQTPSPAIAAKIGEVVLAYYSQMELFSPKERELIDWFVQLSTDDKTSAAAVQPDKWPTLNRFKRYYLERQGHSMPDYMATHLTAKELLWWTDDDAVKSRKVK